MTGRMKFTGLALVLSLAGCAGPAPEGEVEADVPEPVIEAQLLVYTTNYPLAYFAERIGGDRVRVEFPAPSDTDPAYWSPTPDEIAAYQAADVILLNGAGYEGWVAKTSLPESRLVNTAAGFEDRFVVVEEAVVHTHGPEGEHEHENVAFTTWLDPLLATEQARAIRDAFAVRLPEAEAEFQSAFASLEADFAELDGRLDAWAEQVGAEPLLASHPVYQYLAARYDLDLRSVHFEPDEAPGAGAWRDLAALTSGHPARVMLWEATPMPGTEARLREDMGIASVVFDPCAARPEAGDYLSVMRANADRLSAHANRG